jgi:hypothetical protein
MKSLAPPSGVCEFTGAEIMQNPVEPHEQHYQESAEQRQRETRDKERANTGD